MRQTVKIIRFEKSRLNELKTLWQELNTLHGRVSTHFKDHFDTFTFEKRSAELTAKPELGIFVAQDVDTYIGYCIVSADIPKGEIESIFIQPNYQCQGIGTQLTTQAMEWLMSHGCEKLSVNIAEGNDAVLKFYEKFGFKKRFIVLQKNTV